MNNLTLRDFLPEAIQMSCSKYTQEYRNYILQAFTYAFNTYEDIEKIDNSIYSKLQLSSLVTDRITEYLETNIKPEYAIYDQRITISQSLRYLFILYLKSDKVSLEDQLNTALNIKEGIEDIILVNNISPDDPETKQLVNYIDKIIEKSQSKNTNNLNNEVEENQNNHLKKEFTLGRQVLAIHYLLEYIKARQIDHSVKARFIQFLTGRETGSRNIKDTTIYKKVKSPLSINNKTLIGDLTFIRTQFELLGLHEIAKMISNEMSKTEI